MHRLVLFDIDETMIRSDGAGRRAITRALTAVFGNVGDPSGILMSGKTDPQICREILHAAGFTEESVSERLAEAFAIYPPMLAEEIERSPDYRLHAGVTTLLEQLSAHATCRLGLITGNIEAGARLKLAPFGLNSYFGTGAFGSDSHDRMDLPAIARDRAQEFFRTDFSPEDVVIIGDSVNDVRCARGFGAVSIAVNTGRTTRAALEQEQPDFLLSSLADTSSVMAAILSGSGARP